jgi:eukaryotic-like serine/threonine-protein kinase
VNPERWGEIQRQLDVALSLGIAERRIFLESIGAKDEELRRELESLLAVETADPEFMNTPALSLLQSSSLESGSVPNSMLGRVLGAYRVTGQLGAGGMGEVYRAVRADGHYDQQAAVKIVRPGVGGGEFSSLRFRNERQILAKLDHPNIAKILDGGTTEDGLPYFVMELIDGVPITEYCDRNCLSIEGRFRLFRTVCSAVHYAHQHLVVHRDIKPTNILVTPEGVAKLLDFGIAKMLSPDAAAENATLTGVCAMTPEYASPEQLRGEPITTAADVYSLGLVLYELLTGQRAYRFSGRMPHEIARVVLESEPDRPSSAVFRNKVRQDKLPEKPDIEPNLGAESCNLRGFSSAQKLHRRLAGDADNIILKALRKEPGGRYVSADQLSEDIRRHLEGLPITASKGTTAYRVRKYVARHKVGVASIALILLILVTGIVLTFREARIARRNELLAERRFNDVRKLAHSLMFDIHDSIENLPGSTPARKLVVDQALSYLDSLAREAGSDVTLQRELAAGYDRVAGVLGSPYGSNLGDTQGALESYRKALAIREGILKANPGDAQAALEIAVSRRDIAGVAANRADPDAMEQSEQALAAAERVLQANPQNSGAFAEVQIDHDMLAGMLDGEGDVERALSHTRAELPMIEKRSQSRPASRSLRSGIAIVEGRMGLELTQLGRWQEGQGHFDRSIQISEDLAAADATDVERKRILALMLRWFGQYLMMKGDVTGARGEYRRAADILAPLADADPKNLELDYDLASDRAGLGQALAVQGKYQEGLALLEQAGMMLESDMARDPAYIEPRDELLSVRVWSGDAYRSRGETTHAFQSYDKALTIADKLALETHTGRDLSIVGIVYERIGSVLARMRKTELASEHFRQGLQAAEPIMAAKPNVIEARYAVADLYASMGEQSERLASATNRTQRERLRSWSEAKTWYQKSVDAWHGIQNPGVTTPSGFACGSPRNVAAAIARSNQALSTIALSSMHSSPDPE